MVTHCTSQPPANREPDVLVSHYWRGDAICNRSVSDVVLVDTVDIPAPPPRLTADWNREIELRSGLAPGDVETMPLARARARWPDYRRCVAAVSDWTRTLGLPAAMLDTCDVALMACRGARYHHDGVQYGAAAFCNLFLSDDRGLDLHFAFADRRIPLVRGTVVIFDTCQPHAVIARGSSGFNVADFPLARDCTQLFLTWELPIDAVDVGQALHITYDMDGSTSPPPDEAQVWLNGASASVCTETGRWRHKRG